MNIPFTQKRFHVKILGTRVPRNYKHSGNVARHMFKISMGIHRNQVYRFQWVAWMLSLNRIRIMIIEVLCEFGGFELEIKTNCAWHCVYLHVLRVVRVRVGT